MYCPAALNPLQSIVTLTSGNTLMTAHFASHGEASGLVVHLVSIINNFLSQVRGVRGSVKGQHDPVCGRCVWSLPRRLWACGRWLWPVLECLW